MNSEHRLSATKYIWLAFFFALAFTNANIFLFRETPGVANIIMTTIVAIAATGSTAAVWSASNTVAYEDNDATNDAKLKRGERVKRLIDLMDDDELYALRQRLSRDYADTPDDYMTLGDDGELLHTRQGY